MSRDCHVALLLANLQFGGANDGLVLNELWLVIANVVKQSLFHYFTNFLTFFAMTIQQ